MPSISVLIYFFHHKAVELSRADTFTLTQRTEIGNEAQAQICSNIRLSHGAREKYLSNCRDVNKLICVTVDPNETIQRYREEKN